MSEEAVSNWQKYLAEVIGTYILVFLGTGAVVANQVSDGTITHPGIALAFGFVVMTVIYSIGDISGAHINPAVTIAFAFARRFPKSMVFPYVLSQCIGALLGSATLRILFLQNDGLGGTVPSDTWWQSFVLEFLLTAILMFVVLTVTTGSKETGLMAGVAIGSLIALEAMFAGPICGASMNPARSIGPAIISMNAKELANLWIYIAAPIFGAIFGVLAFRGVRHDRAAAKAV